MRVLLRGWPRNFLCENKVCQTSKTSLNWAFNRSQYLTAKRRRRRMFVWVLSYHLTSQRGRSRSDPLLNGLAMSWKWRHFTDKGLSGMQRTKGIPLSSLPSKAGLIHPPSARAIVQDDIFRLPNRKAQSEIWRPKVKDFEKSTRSLMKGGCN